MILKNCITYNLDKFLKDSNVLLITKKSDEIIKDINKQLKDTEVTAINLDQDLKWYHDDKIDLDILKRYIDLVNREKTITIIQTDKIVELGYYKDNPYPLVIPTQDKKAMDELFNDAVMVLNNLSQKDRDFVGKEEYVNTKTIKYRKVYYKNGKPIGFVELDEFNNDKRLFTTIALIESERGYHLASKFIDEAIEFGKTNKYKMLCWDCDKNNINSINLALSKNFKQVKSGVDNMVSFDLKL